jgi:hypothetical protein
MTITFPAASQFLLACAREVVSADDAHCLDQKLIDVLRAACLACDLQPDPPGRHTTIPAVDGLYWYHSLEGQPEPVLIHQARYPNRFKAFNGREQTWLRTGEFFTGPVPPPADR